jgi:hypothetical protein
MRDGTAALFLRGLTSLGDIAANEGLVTRVTFPSQEQWNFFYTTTNACDYGTGCTVQQTIRRLQSVRNSFGYLIKFNYGYNASSSTIDWTNAQAWQTYSAVTGINLSVDYCNPSQDFCPAFSTTWPTVSYTWSPTSQTVTDALGRTTTFSVQPAGITGVQLPGSSGNDISITYANGNNAPGMVQRVDRAGTYWTYSYEPEIPGVVNYARMLVTNAAGGVRELRLPSSAGYQPTYDRNEAGEITT